MVGCLQMVREHPRCGDGMVTAGTRPTGQRSIASPLQDVYDGPMTTATTRKANRYPGTCIACHRHVAAYDGHLAGKYPSGQYKVRHNGCVAVETVAVPSRGRGARVVREYAVPVERPQTAAQAATEALTTTPVVYCEGTPVEFGRTRENDLATGVVSDRMKAMWREACESFRVAGQTKYIKYLDRYTEWGDVSEMRMHAMDAWLDAQDGIELWDEEED